VSEITPTKVSVIGGAGYVGLITGVGLAELGHCVVNVDVDSDRLVRLQEGHSHLFECGLEPLLTRNLDSGRLRFTSDTAAAVAGSDVVFIAVGTPSQEDGRADLSQVIEVAEGLSANLKGYTVVVIKSTVPVGTVEMVRSILRRDLAEGQDFDIVSNPEFLREGKGLFDFFYPDRLVIGAESKKATKFLLELYRPLIHGQVTFPGNPHGELQPRSVPVVQTSLASAQMIKYSSNAFLATRISFINEIADLCERVGADVREVACGMGHDPRIGHQYLEARLGFGGPCLEKDLRALVRIAEGNGHEASLLKAVLDRNERQVLEVIAKLKRATGYLLYRRTIAVYGLAFKSGTNDVRGSVSLKVLDRLRQEGAVVRAHDPLAIPQARDLRPWLTCCDDPYEAVRQADALLILTDWPEYRDLDYRRVLAQMSAPCILDARNLLDPVALRDLGATYVGLGREL
jgi:UDPglucose 6-dehydrogenase